MTPNCWFEKPYLKYRNWPLTYQQSQIKCLRCYMLNVEQDANSVIKS